MEGKNKEARIKAILHEHIYPVFDDNSTFYILEVTADSENKDKAVDEIYESLKGLIEEGKL